MNKEAISRFLLKECLTEVLATGEKEHSLSLKPISEIKKMAETYIDNVSLPEAIKFVAVRIFTGELTPTKEQEDYIRFQLKHLNEYGYFNSGEQNG